ncbi:hypothetical protein [Rhodococcus coprophilus]|uniref:hypothetical protein n=1 Tax=Rhodococcus coprophilus TaxID=38310 RepID=UPI003406FC95
MAPAKEPWNSECCRERDYAPPGDRGSPLRCGICVATIVSNLPFLLPEVAWIFGWTIGVGSTEFAHTMLRRQHRHGWQ